ncbi:hypothetical protein C8A03DRAFT_47164 [Achaetomium macrosporum]|uniref:Uncharacterized protein n=1 Tax=Achaetomium macrosporum TaxID=79813 RepID=A0AAN7HAX3_9PEZI|nr:hypothetical protein C8A03DRAFT_47164 [Achaetomium macrosporum]
MSGYDVAPASYEEMYFDLLKQKADRLNRDPAAQRNDYDRSFRYGAGKRAFFTTKNEFVGTCIPDGRAGDLVPLWLEPPVPFILRPAAQRVNVDGAERQAYSLIGAAYVGGIMSGGMVAELYCGDLMDATSFYVQQLHATNRDYELLC